MNIIAWFFKRDQLVPLLNGICYGLLTALAFAGGELFHGQKSIDFSLALHIAIATPFVSSFVAFIVNYTQERNELIRWEKQLNITSSGRLAATKLGKEVLLDVIKKTLLTFVFTFLGTLCTLSIIIFLPKNPLLIISFIVLLLGFLGNALSHIIYGNAIRWTVGFIIAGLLITYIGIILHIF